MTTPWKRFQLRSWDNFKTYFKIEMQLLGKEWKVILPCVIMQYVHGIFHNLAYWVQGNVLSTEQRFTLHDVGYSIMPELTGTAASISDVLVFAGVFAPALLLIVSIALFRTNPNKPRYIVIVGKRLLLHISICLVFRIISFLVTALPSPAAHCELKFNDACLAANPDDPVPCVVPNPDFNPPSVGEFFTNMDSLNGCGDLMFSSHTIYTMSFILGVWKYWPNKYGITVMICLQIAIAFLIVASRKHYTIDVFSALYIVPLFWFTQDAYMNDINSKDVKVSPKSIFDFYGVDITPDLDESNPTSPEVALQNVQLSVEEESLTGDSESNQPTTAFQRKASM